MLGYILLAIFLWFMYNLVVKLVLPLYNTTKRMQRQFKDIQEKQGAFRDKQNSTQSPPQAAPKQKEGEYIEFEEVK